MKRFLSLLLVPVMLFTLLPVGVFAETAEATTVETQDKVIETDCVAEEEPVVFTITTEVSEGGTVSGAGEYKPGDTVQLVPIADEGYCFAGWYENGELISVEETLRFSAVADRTVSASFEKHTHSLTACEKKDASCTETGYIIYRCSGCNHYEYVELPVIGHDFGAWVQTTAPTCTEKGVETHYCSRCDAFETREVAATGHHYKKTVTKPTCTERGYTTHACSCGDSYVDSYVSIVPHDFQNGKCIVCGEKDPNGKPAAPKVSVAVTASNGKPKLAWAKADGAVKYEVYRATSKSGKYTKLTTTTGTTYTDKTAKKGKTYYYKVKAVCKTSAAASAYSTVKSIKVK